jgi:DNA polymerase III gamma/tau subunit
MLGLAPSEYIQALQIELLQHQSGPLITALSALYGQGYEPAMIAAQLGESLRGLVLGQTLDPEETSDVLTLLQRLLEVPAARSPKQLLELILIEAALSRHPVAKSAMSEIPSKPSKKQEKAAEGVPPPATESKTTTPQPVHVAKPEEPKKAEVATPHTPKAPDSGGKTEVNEIWQQALNEIKKQYNTLYGIARMATPELEGNKLTLHLKFAFHQKRLNEAKNRKIFSDVVERISGRPIEIVCVVSDKAPVAAAKPDVTNISNIFGGAELLES